MSAKQDKLLQQAVTAHKAGDSQAAERLYRSILDIDAAHPDANHNLGVLIVSTQDAKHALPYFKAALEANPKQVQYWESAIDALIRADQIEVARNLLKQGQEKGLKGEQFDKLTDRLNIRNTGTSSSSEKLNEVLTLYKQGKLEEALVLAKKLDKTSLDNPNVPNIYAVINNDLGNYEVAVSAYQRAIELKPDFAQAYSNLGIALYKLGKYQESIVACNKAIDFGPNYAEAHNNLGLSLKAVRKYKEAIVSYNKAVSLKPDFATAHYNLGNVTSALGDSEGAIIHYNKSIQLNPNYVEAHSNLGVALHKVGQYEEANKCYSRALELNPNHLPAISGKGKVLLRVGYFKQGLSMLEKAEGVFSFDVDKGISFRGGA